MVFDTLGDNNEVTPIVISTNRIHCPIPDDGSFSIRVSYGFNEMAGPITFLRFNPLCYDCNPNTKACQLKVLLYNKCAFLSLLNESQLSIMMVH